MNDKNKNNTNTTPSAHSAVDAFDPARNPNRQRFGKKGRLAAIVAAGAIAAGGVVAHENSQDPSPEPLVPPKTLEYGEPKIPPVDPNPSMPPKGPFPEKYDDGVLPGDPDVPADQDQGTPDDLGPGPASPGSSPDTIRRQPPVFGGSHVPTLDSPSLQYDEGLIPAITGEGPNNAPAERVSRTGNQPGQGQGGYIDPNGY